MCVECYSDMSRATPLLNPLECLENHTQYICGTCGRCVCIERDPKRGLMRWNFPFKSPDIARLYLRAADASEGKPCFIYEIISDSGRPAYKIFAGDDALDKYLSAQKGKRRGGMPPISGADEYITYPDTQIRKLTSAEISKYLSERRGE